MASIQIHNLPAGSDLFIDSESFMTELSDAEMMMQGGISPALVVFTLGVVGGIGIGISISVTLS